LRSFFTAKDAEDAKETRGHQVDAPNRARHQVAGRLVLGALFVESLRDVREP